MENQKNNLKLWNEVKQVPQQFTKKIAGGRLKGMTDIKPQWRLMVLTEQFGVCGIGWKYTIDKAETIEAGEEVSAHVWISLYIKVDGEWSDGIVGMGGSMILAKEKYGLHHSDEAFKMATTDALSVACKQIGIAADTYMGVDSSKYTAPPVQQKPQPAKVPSKEDMQKALTACKGVGIEFDDKSTQIYLEATGEKATRMLNDLRTAYKKASEAQK